MLQINWEDYPEKQRQNIISVCQFKFATTQDEDLIRN